MENNLIIPGKSCGNIKIGQNIDEVRNLLGVENSENKYKSGVIKLNFDNIEVWFENSKVTQIAVFGNYKGSTSKGIKIGYPKDTLEKEHSLIYDNEDKYWFSKRLPGILFEFSNGLVSKIFICSN